MAMTGSGILMEVLLKPVDTLGVEVVRRFVEKKDVGLLQEEDGRRAHGGAHRRRAW